MTLKREVGPENASHSTTRLEDKCFPGRQENKVNLETENMLKNREMNPRGTFKEQKIILYYLSTYLIR